MQQSKDRLWQWDAALFATLGVGLLWLTAKEWLRAYLSFFSFLWVISLVVSTSETYPPIANSEHQGWFILSGFLLIQGLFGGLVLSDRCYYRFIEPNAKVIGSLVTLVLLALLLKDEKVRQDLLTPLGGENLSVDQFWVYAINSLGSANAVFFALLSVLSLLYLMSVGTVISRFEGISAKDESSMNRFHGWLTRVKLLFISLFIVSVYLAIGHQHLFTNGWSDLLSPVVSTTVNPPVFAAE